MDVKRPEFIGGGKGELPFNVNVRAVVVAVIAVILIIWIVRGGPAYTVAPDEEGIVLTFGKYTKSTSPGLHFKIPWPVQTVEKAKVAEVKRLEFGFRSSQLRSGETVYRDFTQGGSSASQFLHEAQMLTGDENVVNCSMAVQYRIKNSLHYLFNFRNEAEAVNALRDIGEASLRQAVGDRPIDHVLTGRKVEIQNDIHEKMQELADQYEIGVAITAVQLQDVLPPEQVSTAFQEVASAREERERIINEARGYQREKLPQAEGEAERMLLEAEGYKQARVAEAQGQVSRFLAMAKEYEQAEDITRTRLYLEALSELLPKMKITVIDENAGLINLKSLGSAPTIPPGSTPNE